MAEAVDPAAWGAVPVDSPAAWGAMPVEAQKPSESILPAAITDVPKEIGEAATSAIDKIAALKDRGKQGPIEGLLTTGRAALAVPELVMSPITGAARSLIGHPMADAEHKVGEIIAPQIAAKDDPEKMYQAAKGDVDLALAAARPKAPSVPKVEAPTITELKTAAEGAYKSPEVLNLEIKPGTMRTYSDNAKLSLNQDGFDDIVAPKTFALLERIQNFPPNATVTGQNLNSLRKTLGKVAGSNDPTERAAASMAIDHLDDFIPKIGRQDVLGGDPAAAAAKLEEARGNYAAAMQSEKIDKKTVRAQIRADASNSGMNVENAVRQRMADVVLNPKEARGLSSAELQQAQRISEGTKLQNTLRYTGNALGGGGGLGAVITGIPSAGIAPAVGFGLKLISNRMTLQQANRLSEAIRMRAPLASSVGKFGQAFANYQAQKTPSAYAGAVIAARNLSSNLQGAGFNGAIADLVRSLAIPSQGAAEDRNEIPRRE